MKKLLTLSLLLCLSLFAEPEWADSYDKGLEQAAAEQKMVLVMLSREDCDACWYMENIVFEDDDLVDEITPEFVWVHIDVNDDRVPQAMKYVGTPTFHFLNSEGKKIGHLNGGTNIQDFRNKIKEVKLKKQG
ncbi:MAG: thioredoxin family protein [Campylobacterota bacterium]|nr:thioredoxin family protein [Campylobacterota bacterium]